MINYMATRLDIGCADIKLPGYIGIDAQDRPGVDYVLDVTKEPLPFLDGEADEVYCSHMLEHIDKVQATKVVGEMYRVLKSGGVIEIRVPDLSAALEGIAKYKDDPQRVLHWMEQIYGGSGGSDEYDKHKYGYVPSTLKILMEGAGFVTDSVESKEYGQGGYSIFYKGHKK